MRYVLGAGGALCIYDEDGAYFRPHRHALAALALHDQPFGFTGDDLATLYLLVEILPRTGVHRSHVAALRSIAERIEALLPPR